MCGVSQVSILGMGLMGGSLGLALRQRVAGVTVHGFTRSPERARQALARGAVDHMHDDIRDAVVNADLVVCCAPILAIPEQVSSVRAHLKAGAVVTDVGSTKQLIQQQCAERLQGRDAVFIGSHPIAGSEQQGMEAARADLYQEALVVITPDETAPRESIERLSGCWRQVGGHVVETSAAEHDRILAATSHLPHVVASLLAASIGRQGGRTDLPRFCGTGYRDTTRIAEGGVDIWLDILKSNQTAIKSELAFFGSKVQELIEKLDQQNFSAIEAILREGKNARQQFTAYGNSRNSEE